MPPSPNNREQARRKCHSFTATSDPGHEETHALQQSWTVFEIAGQACNSSSSALASFRSMLRRLMAD